MSFWIFGRRAKRLVPHIKHGKHGWNTSLKDAETGKHWAILSGSHDTLADAVDALKEYERIELNDAIAVDDGMQAVS